MSKLVYKFTTKHVKVPKHDCDIELTFPSGKVITIQSRTSNVEPQYNGSLDIILWDPQTVTCWQGDNMEAAPPLDKKNTHIRKNVSQIVLEIP